MKPSLLILGTNVDPHIERVYQAIVSNGNIDVYVLDFLNSNRFSLWVDDRGEAVLSVNGKRLPRNLLVWDRSKLIPGTAFYFPQVDENSGYAAEEWRALYRTVCGLHRGRVVNPIESRSCLYKPYQQVVAAQVGFAVPRTLVTNERADLESFAGASRGHVIMKSLSSCKVKPASDLEYIPYNVLTMRLSEEDVEGATEEEVAYCPHFLQEEIKKAYELRVVYIDGSVRAFKVHSQKYRTSEVDWRKGLGFVDFEPCSLAPEIEARIGMFMKRMGLFAGSLDLVVESDNTVWFLECNQEGAWAWLDDLDGGQVTKAFADALSRKTLSVCSGAECFDEATVLA
jgi:hypothetical protein